MKVKELMSSDVASIESEKSIKQASQKMRDQHVGILPVLKDGQLVGTITDRDIAVYAIAMGRDPVITPVEKAMHQEVVTCSEDDDIEVAAKLMGEKQIRRVAVLGGDNNLSGILSVDDLARASHELAGNVLKVEGAMH